MHPLPFQVLALVDQETLGSRLVEAAAAAVAGGLTWLCLRARYADAEERTRLVLALREACPDAVLSVHGDPGVCRALGVRGLHLPSNFRDVTAVRQAFPSAVLGVSCHGPGELEAAERAGADYALLSPFFSPASKETSSPVLGPEGFRAALRERTIPVLALGGLTPERLALAAGAGAAGAAVLGGLFLVPDVACRARAYRESAERAWALPRREPAAGPRRPPCVPE
jgi:thiamine-phosphate pyrophosphorylase